MSRFIKSQLKNTQFESYFRQVPLGADGSSLSEASRWCRSEFSLGPRDSRLIRCLSVSAVSSQILEVTDPPEGISCTDSHHLLPQLRRGGASIPWLRSTTTDASSCSIFAAHPHPGPPLKTPSSYQTQRGAV